MTHSVTGWELIMWSWQWHSYWTNSMPFIELRSFVTLFTRACYWTPFWSRWIQCTLLYQISFRCTYFCKEVSFLYDGCLTFCILFSSFPLCCLPHPCYISLSFYDFQNYFAPDCVLWHVHVREFEYLYFMELVGPVYFSLHDLMDFCHPWFR